MKKAEFDKQRDVLYREMLVALGTIARHPATQAHPVLHDCTVAIAKMYRSLNQIIDEVVR